MRIRHIVACVILAAGGVCLAGEPSDADISRRLVGAWTTQMNHGDEKNQKADGTIRYAKDGTFVAQGKVKLGEGEVAEVKVEGTWKVEGGAVRVAVTKSSHPGLAPVGAKLKEQVIAIDDKVLRVKRGLGEERERTRVEE